MIFSRRRKEQELLDQAVRAAIEQTNKVYEGVIERLLEQNKLLLDRVMAKDYQEYALYSNDGIVTEEKKPIPPDADDLNAGEVLFYE